MTYRHLGLRAHQMWSGDGRPFEGTHCQLERPLNSRPSLSTPHPPILVGGSGEGEKKTLRLAAKLAILPEHCSTVGRDDADSERTTLGRLSLSKDGSDGTQTVDQAVDRFAAYVAIGVGHAIVSFPDVSDPDAFELVPELVQGLADVLVAGR